MRSGITGKVLLFRDPSEWPPSITISDVPKPEILAPREFKNSARQTTSGSSAAFFKIVLPLAPTAAIIRVSVPVTLETRKKNSVPTKPFGAVISYLSLTSETLAPIFSNPSINKSIGRLPITQPPGCGKDTLPKRANNGPASRMEARILLALSLSKTLLDT